MASSSGTHESFVCTKQATLSGPSELCFEELRIDDYLQAYRTTGRPPAPVTGPSTFTPILIPRDSSSAPSSSAGGRSMASSSSLSASTGTPVVPQATDPAALPEWQMYAPPPRPRTASSSVETMESLTADVKYAWFSFEELRCYAYLRGNRAPPPHLVLLLPAPAPSAGLKPKPPPAGEYYATPGDHSDMLLCISADPRYSKHSVEELRVAFLKAGGRPLTSDGIQGLVPANAPPVAPAPAPAPTLFGGGPATPVTPTAAANPLFGSAPTATTTRPTATPQSSFNTPPKFSFKF